MSRPNVQGGVPADWPLRLHELRLEWSTLEEPSPAAEIASWSEALARLTSTMVGLKRSGQWQRGPVDLLSICGLHRWELAHSAALGWLCDPEARHGLGVAFLAAIVTLTGDPFDLTEDISVDTEVTRANSRADVVISASTWTLVVEVKVDAAEGIDQCQRLYTDWADESGVRFVFLTRHGYEPLTTLTDDARGAWRTLSWPSVTSALAAVTAVTPPGPAAGAVADYLATLQRLYGRVAT